MVDHHLAGTVVVVALAGCAVVDPPGWAQRQALPMTEIRAKPWVMYGVAPQRWVSPFGEIEIEHDGLLTVVGPLTPGFTYHVRFRGSAEPGITCQMYVEPAGVFAPHPETHGALLGCVSAARGLVFTAGVGCRYPEHLLAPSCHRGLLRFGGDRVLFQQGFLERLKAPVGYLSFSSADEELLGAANIVAEMNISLWTRPITSETERQRQRSLALLTTALHHFHHFTSAAD